MAIVVAYKVAPDPHDALVTADGVVDWSRSRPALSADDPVALALGRTLADATGAALVGVSVGAEAAASPTARKAALGRGLDRVVAVADDATWAWRARRVAAALADLARRADATLVLCGDASIDENAKVVPPLLAAELGWPCLQAVTGVTPEADGWLVTQATGAGSRTLRVAGGVVLAVLPDVVPAPAPGMKELLAAGRKPFELVPADAGSDTPEPQIVARRRPPQRQRRNLRFEGPSAVADLVTALAADPRAEARP